MFLLSILLFSRTFASDLTGDNIVGWNYDGPRKNWWEMNQIDWSAKEGSTCGEAEYPNYNLWGPEEYLIHTFQYEGDTDVERDTSCCNFCMHFPGCEYWVRNINSRECFVMTNGGFPIEKERDFGKRSGLGHPYEATPPPVGGSPIAPNANWVGFQYEGPREFWMDALDPIEWKNNKEDSICAGEKGVAEFVDIKLGGQEVKNWWDMGEHHLYTLGYEGNTDAEKDRSCCKLCEIFRGCEYWVRATDRKDCYLMTNSGSPITQKAAPGRRSGIMAKPRNPQDCVRGECCRIATKRGVIPGVTYGRADPIEIIDWTQRDCDTVVGGKSLSQCPYSCECVRGECCTLAEEKGVRPGITWGSAQTYEAVYWQNHKCDAFVGGADVPNCPTTCGPNESNEPPKPQAPFKCNDDHLSSGVGSVTRTSFEGCSDRFKNTGKMFVYYAASQHCQETKARNTHYNKGWKVCTPATTVSVNNFDWNDEWGWCKAEDKRKELGRVGGGREGCLKACEKETWNGKYPRGCEYSGRYGTCNVFFGKNVRSAQSGSSYRCNINIASGVNFAGTASTVLMTTSSSSDFSSTDFAVYGFAAVGLGVLLYGAARHFCATKTVSVDYQEV